MSSKPLLTFLKTEARHLEQAGLLRRELAMVSPQGPTVTLNEKELLNLASSDYLGLSGHGELKKAGKLALDAWGSGLASPRPVTGTLRMHEELEAAVAKFVGTDDALVYPTGYHANTGLFESLFNDRDYLFCDEQVHPSLADGLRLSRGRIYSYRNLDLAHLEDRLKRSRPARFRAIVTDGFFSAVGEPAKLADLYTLADKYEALVVVDDSEGLGVLGARGRGTHEAQGLEKRVDVLTGSFGNALGGGGGGFVTGPKELIAWLRQKSRPYLASAAVSPASTAMALKALELIQSDPKPREALKENIQLMRTGLREQGLKVVEAEHPAISVVAGDAVSAQRMTDLLLKKGVFAMGFCYPVVPEGAARVRAQVTARHTQKALKNAIAAFGESWKETALTTGTHRTISAA